MTTRDAWGGGKPHSYNSLPMRSFSPSNGGNWRGLLVEVKAEQGMSSEKEEA